MQPVLNIVCFVAVSLPLVTTAAQPQNRHSGAVQVTTRTVTQSEIGLIFAYPTGFSWRDVGAYVGTVSSDNFAKMSAGALKIQHGRFQHFEPADDNKFAFFPYSQLKRYDADEMSAGRQPLFVTATYQGKKRPVYFSWSLGLRGNVPSTSREQWMQAVDVSSDRFIDFWVNHYVRTVVWHNRLDISDRWVGIDNCTFMWELYGVIDDDGHFVSSVPWDAPYPQDSNQYLESIKQFFHKLKQVAPEIKVMCNIGFSERREPISIGICGRSRAHGREHIGGRSQGIRATRKYDFFKLDFLVWLSEPCRCSSRHRARDNAEDLRTAHMIYLLIKGPNFFFAPQFKDSPSAVPPDQYVDMRSDLGEPLAPMRIEREGTKGHPYEMYSRNYQRGTVYVNWTGTTQEIPLLGNRHYFDSSGKRITHITVPDLTGTYVLIEAPKHSAHPMKEDVKEKSFSPPLWEMRAW